MKKEELRLECMKLAVKIREVSFPAFEEKSLKLDLGINVHQTIKVANDLYEWILKNKEPKHLVKLYGEWIQEKRGIKK